MSRGFSTSQYSLTKDVKQNGTLDECGFVATLLLQGLGQVHPHVRRAQIEDKDLLEAHGEQDQHH